MNIVEICYEILLLSVILSLPIPSTPFLILHFSTNEIAQSGAMYLVSSSLMCVYLCKLGSIFSYERILDFFEEIIEKITVRNSVQNILDVSSGRLRQSTFYDNFMARMLGVPVHHRHEECALHGYLTLPGFAADGVEQNY